MLWMAHERERDLAGERAQPGDVLGIDHNGEITSLGDTARDERERLQDREEDAADERTDERRNRHGDTSHREERILRDREDATRDRDPQG